jgi:hypothetical protein
MKLPKNMLRVVLALAIAATCSVAAHADSSNDPRVVIKDAPPGKGVDENFSFRLPGRPGTPFAGDLSFRNVTSQTWTSLALFVSSSILNVSCGGGGGIFNHCTTFIDPNNTHLTEMLFTNTIGFGALGTGILPCENFTFTFSGMGGSNWESGTKFRGVAAVPEPSTIAFLFTGIGAIATRRKLWKRAS